MATLLYNEKKSRVFRINGFVDINDGSNINRLLFIQGLTISIDASLFQRDNIGVGESVFTQNGDVVGSFSFSTKNTVDLYDNASTPVLKRTVSYWMSQIAQFDPPILDFIETLNSPDATGNKFARIKFKGRIITPEIDMSVDDAVGDVNVEGEVTEFTSALRSST